jgi:hypothetical protein
MGKNRLGLWAPILVIAAALLMLAVSTGVDAAKPQVGLSYQLYSFDDGTFVVDYMVQSKGGGGMDLAVSHECFSGDQLVQAWTNRLYWSGNGANKTGHWNTQVEGGNECFAVVVDLDQPASGEVSLTSFGYAEVSPVVRYVVQER